MSSKSRRRCVAISSLSMLMHTEFPDSKPQMTISAGLPNLAGNHPRVEVERNDLYRSVTAIAIRERFKTTRRRRRFERRHVLGHRPLDGLVYTVVHDPPGGNVRRTAFWH